MTDREFVAYCAGIDIAVELTQAQHDRLIHLAAPLDSRLSQLQLCDLAELRLDLAEAREDTERLTFMFGDPENGASHDQLKNVWENAVTLHGARAEIDAARGKV